MSIAHSEHRFVYVHFTLVNELYWNSAVSVPNGRRRRVCSNGDMGKYI